MHFALGGRNGNAWAVIFPTEKQLRLIYIVAAGINLAIGLKLPGQIGNVGIVSRTLYQPD